MDITIIASERSAHQGEHALALQAGLLRHGIAARIEVPRPILHAPTRLVACWGWRIGEQLRRMGKSVLVMERGYVGDRFRWSSLGWNGLNGRARFAAREDGGARFREHFGELAPWRAGGEYVLLVQQVPGDASLSGRNLDPWYGEITRRARKLYGIPVAFRMHPEAIKRGYARRPPSGAELIGGELADNLARAALVVTWNSNTGVDAVLAGVPAVTFDRGAMAWDVAAHDLGAEPFMPAREAWASRLAWAQWRIEEIASGEAWEVVREGLPGQPPGGSEKDHPAAVFDRYGALPTSGGPA